MTTAVSTTLGTLTMRPRRASENARRTQVQIPLRVLWFFGAGITNMFGEFHPLIMAHARGILNTVKVEVPEIGRMIDPVLVFTRYENGTVSYRAHDAATSSYGFDLMERLRAGFGTTTVTTMPAGKEANATWYQVQS